MKQPQSWAACLVSRKRFAEAIPLLEAATKENPDSAGLQMSLGRAYLLSGNQEKAISVFNTALKLSPKAGMMKNDVGYELADANVKLPEALQYAKEAVQEQETASREVHLEKLEVDDLDHTRHLALTGTRWDGCFRMGNLHEAETYLFAAFHLSQGATIADHLGQVYEQEHKLDAAIRMYRLALAQTLHPPETQGRLDHLVQTKTESDSSFQGGAELSQMRTTKVGRLVPGLAIAEFFFLFAPGPKVVGVKFVSGSETLRTADKALAASAFNVPFPAGSDARLLRRGILGCYPTTGCALVMFVPSLVQSVH